jgi:acetyl esterase
MLSTVPEQISAQPSEPLDGALADIGKRIRESGIPDLYDGCLLPHGGPVSRERARNVRAVFYPKPTVPMGTVQSHTLTASGVDVPMRIVWPHVSALPGKPVNTLVYFHGGGFVVGDLDSHEAHAARLANEAQCVVVNVGYRLAPEHRFPAAYEDCLAATLWARSHIDSLGGDTRRLAVAGDSAGGNLAASVALTCRDQGLPLAAQLLLYPATDLSRMQGMPERAYLGDEHLATAALDPRASPALAANHQGLAPTILAVGRHDFLYADNWRYAKKLQAAKVPLLYREFPTLNHGFFSYTAVSPASLTAAQVVSTELLRLFQRA